MENRTLKTYKIPYEGSASQFDIQIKEPNIKRTKHFQTAHQNCVKLLCGLKWDNQTNPWEKMDYGK